MLLSWLTLLTKFAASARTPAHATRPRESSVSKNRRRRALCVGMTIVTAACVHSHTKQTNFDENCPTDAPALTVPTAARESLPKGVFWSTTEEKWATLARDIPGGFGGIIRKDGAPLVYLVDTTQRAAAIAALTGQGALKSSDAPRIRAARWSFDQLYDWNRYVLLHYTLPNPDVVAWSIDEQQNRLAFDVTDESSRRRLVAALRALRLPCFLVDIDVTGPAVQQKAVPDST